MELIKLWFYRRNETIKNQQNWLTLCKYFYCFVRFFATILIVFVWHSNLQKVQFLLQ